MSKTLGDCILHADHHAMEQECWRTIFEWIKEHCRLRGGFELDYQTVLAYKAAYEQELLLKVLKQ
jgi:hypothetical protein